MKRFCLLMAALLSACILCACGEGHGPAESASEATSTLEDSAQLSQDPVLHYQTIQSLDWRTSIERVTLDPQGYYLSVFFEVPCFHPEINPEAYEFWENKEGYQKIEQFFDELQRQFFSPENELLTHIWEGVTDPDGFQTTGESPFFYERRAWVNSHTEKLVSVSIGYQWHMGGVVDTGSDSYTFRTDTGELVRLTDLVDEGEEELLEIIFAVLEEINDETEQKYGVRDIELDYLQDYTLDDFEFAVYEDGIIIHFDKYEAAHGAYGGFDIELPVQLNPKF